MSVHSYCTKIDSYKLNALITPLKGSIHVEEHLHWSRICHALCKAEGFNRGGVILGQVVIVSDLF